MVIQIAPIPLFQARTNPRFRGREPKFTPASMVGVKFIELFCQSGGSNLNAGTDQNNSPTYTAANGSWNASTRVYTPTDGSNPYGQVKPGQFLSIFADAATVTGYVAKVIDVQNAVNGAITTSNAAGGTAPGTTASGISVRAGGAWLGPNGASVFPFSLTNLQNIAASADNVRINLKNDQTYSITVAIVYTPTLGIVVQGYNTVPGDGATLPGDLGKATIDSGTAVGTVVSNTSNNHWVDIVFTTSFATSNPNLVVAGNSLFVRCVFKGSRGAGLIFTSSNGSAIECEMTGCATGLQMNVGLVLRCFIHHNSGVGVIVGSNPCAIIKCIIANNDGHGVQLQAGGRNGMDIVANNDFYNNSGDGVLIVSSHINPIFIENNNLIDNSGAGINNQSTAGSGVVGWAYNNGYLGNGSPDVLRNIFQLGKVSYPYGSSVYLDPDNGDFSIILIEAIGAGHSAFTETEVYTSPNTRGFPTIGAADALGWAQIFNIPDTIQLLPAGYVGHEWLWTWAFHTSVTVTVYSGTLPPGLTFTQLAGNQIQIEGAPTTIGTYNFVLRITGDTGFGDSMFQIEINEDPDSGSSGMIGG